MGEMCNNLRQYNSHHNAVVMWYRFVKDLEERGDCKKITQTTIKLCGGYNKEDLIADLDRRNGYKVDHLLSGGQKTIDWCVEKLKRDALRREHLESMGQSEDNAIIL